MQPEPFTGLYAITGPTRADLPLTDAVAAAVAGGARMIQYREKTLPFDERLAMARQLATYCRQYAVPFIVNDDVELARACSADGVHLGVDDAAATAARARLGTNAVIGASCYNSLERAQDAAGAGVDYVAFGRFYPSASKPDAVTADIRLLRQARAAIDLPIVAIGGITPDNGAILLEAGADVLAAIDGVFGQPDIEFAARQYSILFDQGIAD